MKKVLLLVLLAVLPFALSAQQKKQSTNAKSEQTAVSSNTKPGANATASKSGSQGSSSGQIVKSATVNYIKDSAPHFSDVIIEGQLTHQLSDREFIFTDSTGNIKVELTGEAEYSLDGNILLGSTVRALGVVKKRLWGDTVVEIFKLKITTPSSVAGL